MRECESVKRRRGEAPTKLSPNSGEVALFPNPEVWVMSQHGDDALLWMKIG